MKRPETGTPAHCCGFARNYIRYNGPEITNNPGWHISLALKWPADMKDKGPLVCRIKGCPWCLARLKRKRIIPRRR